jgi:hypothetical protein
MCYCTIYFLLIISVDYIFEKSELKIIWDGVQINKKTKQRCWNEKDLEKRIQETGLGYLNAAALKYNIPYAALFRHVKSGSFGKKKKG